MNYLLNKKNLISQKSGKLRMAIFTVFVLIIFYFLISKIFLSPVYSLATNLLSVENYFSEKINDILLNFYFKSYLVQSNKDLKEEIFRLREFEIEAKYYEEENILLNELLGNDLKNDRVVAVILKPPYAPYDTLIINTGEKDGIKNGDLVFAGDKILVGKIAEVFSKSSKVKLFSSPGEEQYVNIGENNIPTILIGKGGGNFYTNIPMSVKIAVGDIVLTTEDDFSIIGVVVGIKTNKSNLTQEVFITTPVNIFEIKRLLVDRELLSIKK